MAIQPIDLSTIYSQMDSISQLNGASFNAAQAASKEHVEKMQNQEFQNRGAVHKVSSEKDESQNIKNKNEGSASKNGAFAEEHKNKDSEEPQKKVTEVKDLRVGRIIDIMG